MQFVVIGKDGDDPGAMERRLTAREAHLKFGDEMEAAGNRWYGAAILDENGKMTGSMAVMDFPSEKDIEEWLAHEPYITGDVWRTVEIYRCNVKDPWKFNRPKEFFETRGYRKIT